MIETKKEPDVHTLLVTVIVLSGAGIATLLKLADGLAAWLR
jgi:hypothetical protein